MSDTFHSFTKVRVAPGLKNMGECVVTSTWCSWAKISQGIKEDVLGLWMKEQLRFLKEQQVRGRSNFDLVLGSIESYNGLCDGSRRREFCFEFHV